MKYYMFTTIYFIFEFNDTTFDRETTRDNVEMSASLVFSALQLYFLFFRFRYNCYNSI